MIQNKQNSIRLLLLSKEGSGTQYSSKMMKRMFKEGCGSEKKIFEKIIKTFVLYGTKEVAIHVETMGFMMVERNMDHIKFFQDTEVMQLELTDKDVLARVSELWMDPTFVYVWTSIKENLEILEHLDYFIVHLLRIANKNYIPSNEDIEKVQLIKANPYTTSFKAFNFKFDILDCRGTVMDSNKLYNLKTMEFCNTIVFSASLMGFNDMSEGSSQLRLSMEYFRNIINERKLKCFTIVIFSKVDLFKEKISTLEGQQEFELAFPDFRDYFENIFPYILSSKSRPIKANELVFRAAIKFLESKFKELAPRRCDYLAFYPCSKNIGRIKFIFESMKDYVFIQRMKASGITW